MAGSRDELVGELSAHVGHTGVSPVRETGLMIIGSECVENVSLTFCKMRELFRETIGLDIFLVCKEQATGQVKEKVPEDTFHISRFCQLVCSTPEGLSRCNASHGQMMEKAFQSNGPGFQYCHAGLVTFHFPVLMGGEQADIQTTCALDEEPSLTRARRGRNDLLGNIAVLGLSRKQLAHALDNVPVVVEATKKQVVEWLGLFASYLSETALPSDVPVPNHTEGGNGAIEGAGAAIQNLIQQEIARYVVLPPKRENRCCGCTPAVVDQVRLFVNRHYDLAFSTQMVAWALGFDPSYFAKTFKRLYKESMAKYLKRVRLQRARKLLESPYVPIEEIAKQTGFSDPSYFTRSFRKEFGATPSQYRHFIQTKGSILLDTVE